MPTRERRPLIKLALRSFQQQDWPNLELCILEDGDDNISDLLPTDPRITYTHSHTTPAPTGTKLNWLIHNSRGLICTEWDDDDWSAPHRTTDLVTRLLASARHVTGYDTILYWDMTRNQARRYKWPRPSTYVLGTSQTFYRAWGLRHPNIPTHRGCDTAFSQTAAAEHQCTSADPGQLMVARYHALSKWGNPQAFYPYPLISTSELPQLFFDDMRAAGQW
jgi:hypothetical protein